MIFKIKIGKYRMETFLYVTFLISSGFICVQGHPQCMDSDPPFNVKGSDPVFCQRYKEFGCCTREQNVEVQTKYNSIKDQITSMNLPLKCESYLKDILCQTCSPYAAHVFEVEENFPDLCPGFCSKVYDECRDMIPLITNDYEIVNALSDKSEFCDVVNLEHTPYCWPDIIDNTDLNKELDRQTKSTVGCLCLKEFATGLHNPMRFQSPKDGTGRIFVLEQRGFIWIFSKDGKKFPQPFLDISDRIKKVSFRGNENGLIGMVFHNDYKNNRKVYIHYTIKARYPFDGVSVISVFRASLLDPNRIDMTSERIIMEENQPSSIHNSGEMLFDEDDYLYIFHGDGGPAFDKHNNGQNRSTLLGSILRIDVSDPTRTYKVPPDNPFVGMPGIKPEIWAYGVRNPWRADYDEGDPETGYGKGRIIFGDVGQARWEELDVLFKGGNYGWRPKEGDHCSLYNIIQQPQECNSLKGQDIRPIGDYSHSSFGNAIVPGHVYRGCHSPALNGLYIFGFHLHWQKGGRLFFLNETAPHSNTWETKEIQLCGTDICYNGWSNDFDRYVMGFGEDEDGEIYMMSSKTAMIYDGSARIFRLVDPNRRGDPDLCRSAGQSTTVKPPVCEDDANWKMSGKIKLKQNGKKLKCKNCSCQQILAKGVDLLKKGCTHKKYKIVREKCCALCKQHGFL